MVDRRTRLGWMLVLATALAIAGTASAAPLRDGHDDPCRTREPYGGSDENYARVITKGASKSLCTWIGKWPSIFRDHSCY